MKSVRVCITALILLPLLLVGFVCPVSADRGSQVVGDYLFEMAESRAVFLTTIFEKDGTLYVLTDLADDSGELVSVKSKDNTYSVSFRRGGEFTLVFSHLEDGRFSTMKMIRRGFSWEARGSRFEPELAKLRDRYSVLSKPYTYRAPTELDDGWKTGSIDDTAIDAGLLSRMMDDIYANHDYMHSMLIVKDGILVLEEYMNGWDPPRLHRLQSVTKSFTSTVIGLAIREGLIGGVDDPISNYLPEYSSLFEGQKNDICFRHLLSMSAGFEWNEAETYYADPSKCDSHVAEASEDYIEYVLKKPIVTEPGTVYYYNSGYPNILGYIVERRADENIIEFAEKHLFKPLGTERYIWMATVGENRPSCSGGLRLTSRDLAKYGALYLNRGVWQGKRILPEAWVEDSVKLQIDADYGKGYGYFWSSISVGELNILFASGTGGQYVALVPDLDAVIVTTAKFNTDKNDVVAGLLIQYVVPALVGKN